jgi:hypothetical protein
MGSLNLAYPKRMGGTAQEQISALYRSQCEIIDWLNLSDWSAEAVLQEIAQGIDEDAALRTAKEKKLTGFESLKQLIIKTADFSMENSEQFSKTLKGGFVAKSTFGEYVKQTSLTLTANSEGITQLFDYTDGINNQYTGKSQQYVKTGLLYYDGVTPRYGVGVGNISTTVQSGNEVINTSAGEVVTVTPGEIKFWQQGVPVAWLTDKVLHFPSGTLEAWGAKISGEITATKLTISENAEISGLYLEKFKLRGNLPVYEASSVETLVGYLGVYVETYDGETNKQISLRSPNESMVSVSNGRVLFLAQGSADAESGGMRITPTSARIYTTDCGVELRETRDVSIEGDSTQVSVLYFGPSSSGDVRLGTGKRLWNSVWAVDDVIQTSDLNEKNSISYDMERYAALFDRLKPAHYKLNAGTSGRVHVGMIAQDVEEAMTAVGLTGQEFAGICKAAKDEGGYSYFLRYGEFIALCIDQIQKLKTRIAALEGTT